MFQERSDADSDKYGVFLAEYTNKVYNTETRKELSVARRRSGREIILHIAQYSAQLLDAPGCY